MEMLVNLPSFDHNAHKYYNPNLAQLNTTVILQGYC